MLGKVKKWFGIEGLKIQLVLDESYNKEEEAITGYIHMESMNEESVNNIAIKLVERYSRGRGKSKLIDEYDLGQLTLSGPIQISANEPVKIPFTLRYKLHLSPMEKMAKKNFFGAGVAALANLAKRASSVYRIEVEADVAGTKFNPFAKTEIKIS